MVRGESEMTKLQVEQLWYTRDDVAKMLGVSRRTVQRLDLKGKVPGRRRLNQRVVRYYRPAIDKWVMLRSK